jgi:DNA-binding CsgD family transcriptional regulator
MPADFRASSVDFATVVDGLRLAILVFRGNSLAYQNPAAASLASRLRAQYHVDLLVILRDHLGRVSDGTQESRPAVTLLTAAGGESLYIHVMPHAPAGTRGDVTVSVRELGIEREAFARRYRLSRREAEVAELVLRGYPNPEIGTALKIAPTTIKRHLTRIFRKTGVRSRTRLVNRLA